MFRPSKSVLSFGAGALATRISYRHRTENRPGARGHGGPGDKCPESSSSQSGCRQCGPSPVHGFASRPDSSPGMLHTARSRDTASL